MNCPNCGREVQNNEIRCVHCAAVLAGAPAYQPTRTSGMAITAFILGLLGALCLSVLAGVPAIILGILALSQIANARGAVTGRVWAIFGIVLGCLSPIIAIVGILAAIAVPNFLEAQTRSQVSRARTDMRSIGTALEAYRIDRNCFPPRLSNLTTPVAYMTRIPNDPFLLPRMPERNAMPGNAAYRYATDGSENWLLYSPGPDRQLDIPAGTPLWEGDLVKVAYDATNGTTSRGDIFRVKDPTKPVTVPSVTK